MPQTRRQRSWRFISAPALLFSALVFAPVAVPAGAVTQTAVLTSGSTLAIGQQLMAIGGVNWLSLHPNGNLVLSGPHGTVWTSGTGGSGAVRLVMRPNGNAVLLDAGNNNVWSTHSTGNPSSRMRVDAAGQLQVVTPGGIVLWQDGVLTGMLENQLLPGQSLAPGQMLVSLDGAYRAGITAAGALEVLSSGGASTWSNGTSSGTGLTMRSDGELSVTTTGGASIWSSGTSSDAAAHAALGTLGALKVIGTDGLIKWTTAPPAPPPPPSLAQTIVSIGVGQDQNAAKVAETPMGSNCNPYTAFFGRGVNNGCQGSTRSEAWCADFAQWVWWNSGALTDGINAYSFSFVDYGQAHGTFKQGPWNDPQPGDAVVFGNMTARTGVHVGIVTAVSGAMIKMVSGNYGDAVIETGFFDPTNIAANGTGTRIVGYVTPVAVSAASLHPATAAATSVRVPAAPSLALINSQDGGH